MKGQASPFQRFSDDEINLILDEIDTEPRTSIPLARRAYLSVESFKPAPRPSPDQAEVIANFRLTCRRFSVLGAKYQFSKLTTRFSSSGFKRLRAIAGQPHLAQHVRKFSYLIPQFYGEDTQRTRNGLLQLKGKLMRRERDAIDVRSFLQKMTSQKDIVESGDDVNALKEAFCAFSLLQHVQILRVLDEDDVILLSHLRRSQNLGQDNLDFKWTPACTHCTKTIGEALLVSKSECSRFSSPMLSPNSVQALAENPPSALQSLVKRMQSLELHFDDATFDLDHKMTELSPLFHEVFSNAESLQAVHFGFPSQRPLTIRLDDIFQGIASGKLVAFGIQSWKLDADEIIAFVRRHREKLRGLRLRDVQLKESSMWKDVLRVLREELRGLKWVSLRRIGYAKHFDELSSSPGIEIEDIPAGFSSSDEESVDDERDPDADALSDEGDADTDFSADSEASSGQEDYDDSGEDGPSANDMGFPVMSDDEPANCDCGDGASDLSDAEDFRDDGQYVSNGQRKLWEKWSTRRCSIHNSKD